MHKPNHSNMLAMVCYLIQRKVCHQFRRKLKEAVFLVVKNNSDRLNSLITKHFLHYRI